MAKEKKVSIRSIDDAVDTVKNNTATIDFNGVEIKITKTISFNDMLQFVNDTVKGCFVEETGEYTPEVLSFMLRIYTLAYYTNINLPQNIEKQYDFAYKTGLYETVISNINQEQYKDICNAIHENVAHIADANVVDINKQFASIQDSFEDLSNQVKTLFDGVNKEDITNALRAVSNDGIDEGRLIQAFINEKYNQ